MRGGERKQRGRQKARAVRLPTQVVVVGGGGGGGGGAVTPPP